MNHTSPEKRTSEERTGLEGRMIRLTAADGHRFDAWESGPPNAAHALVVVQEIFGLTDHIKDVCAELGRKGYHVLSPALFDRTKPQTVLTYSEAGMKEGLQLRSEIAADDIQKDLAACTDHLRKTDDQRPVGIFGFCWGGLVAWLAATQSHQFNAAVSWYGGGIANHANTPPHCPTQLHFGGEDPSIPHTDIQAIREKRPDVEVFLYDNAGHGFGCPQRPSFNQNARDLAWSRSTDFFKQTLKYN